MYSFMVSFPFILWTYETWYAFSVLIFRTLPKISKEEFGLIFDELDDTRDFKVNLRRNSLVAQMIREDTLKITIHIKTFIHSSCFVLCVSCWADKQGWVRWPLSSHCSKIPKGGSGKYTYSLSSSTFRNFLTSNILLHHWSCVFSLQPSLFEKFPQIYHSALSQQLRAFVRSPNFGYAISFILVVNFIAVVVETTVYLVPIKCTSFKCNS